MLFSLLVQRFTEKGDRKLFLVVNDELGKIK